MMSSRRHPFPQRPSDAEPPASGGGAGGVRGGEGQAGIRPPAQTGRGGERRLNLLLSWANWRPESWVDLLEQLLEPMGVESVRAKSAAEAEQVIRSIPVHIAVVDLRIPLRPPAPPLPPNAPTGAQVATPAPGASEEGGPRVLELLRRLEQPPPTVVVKYARTERDDPRHLAAALRSDAFAVVDRAGANLEQMLRILQRVLHRFYENRWPDERGQHGGRFS